MKNAEQEMQIDFCNSISVEDYNNLRASVGWLLIDPELAQKGLENTAFLIVATDNDKPVGMARVITDYGYIVYIADVIVAPEYQGKGIGRELLTKIMTYIDDNIANGQTKSINLMAAAGKENFYKKFGFEQRPNEKFGCGMSQWYVKN